MLVRRPPARPTAQQAVATANNTLARLRAVNQRLDRVLRFQEQQADQDNRAMFTSVLTDLAREGRIGSAEVGPLTEALLAMSDQAAAKLLNALKSRPKTNPSPERDQAGEQTIAQHWESFSERFTRLGVTKQALVGAFKKARLGNAELTAAEYLACGRRR
jgi:hypothetical protein